MLTVAAGCQEERTAIDKQLLVAKEIVRERTDLIKRLGDQVGHNLQDVSSHIQRPCSASMMAQSHPACTSLLGLTNLFGCHVLVQEATLRQQEDALKSKSRELSTLSAHLTTSKEHNHDLSLRAAGECLLNIPAGDMPTSNICVSRCGSCRSPYM